MEYKLLFQTETTAQLLLTVSLIFFQVTKAYYQNKFSYKIALIMFPFCSEMHRSPKQKDLTPSS